MFRLVDWIKFKSLGSFPWNLWLFASSTWHTSRQFITMFWLLCHLISRDILYSEEELCYLHLSICLLLSICTQSFLRQQLQTTASWYLIRSLNLGFTKKLWYDCPWNRYPPNGKGMEVSLLNNFFRPKHLVRAPIKFLVLLWYYAISSYGYNC